MEGFEAHHWGGDPFGETVALLQDVIEVLDLPDRDEWNYLLRDRYGRPGKGDDKGSVEGLVGYARRNFMVPIPNFASWEEFNAYLEAQCSNHQNDILRGHKETISDRLQRDLAAMKPPGDILESEVADFCAAQWPDFTPPLTPIRKFGCRSVAR